jgi:Ca2+-binding EF-hand superfamily protein
MTLCRSTAPAVLLVALFAGTASADHHAGDDDHHTHMADTFRAADSDGNGSLDREEAKTLPRVAKNFERLDTDKDGAVSQEELAAGMKRMHGKSRKMHRKAMAAFQKADADQDGTLDRSEAAAMPRVARNFEAIDTDGSGTVSLAEMRAFMKAKRPRDED